jgi:hypothetical protein
MNDLTLQFVLLDDEEFMKVGEDEQLLTYACSITHRRGRDRKTAMHRLNLDDLVSFTFSSELLPNLRLNTPWRALYDSRHH